MLGWEQAALSYPMAETCALLKPPYSSPVGERWLW
jgi:hypothetical protein